MKTRGEQQFLVIPVLVARLYDYLTHIKGIDESFREIADFVSTRLQEGNLLDVGTGPGRLIVEISKKNPLLDLFGLDISSSMIEVAKRNIRSVKAVDLRVGNIIHTDYPDDFFDIIVSTGSFYNWDKPVEGLNEIHRILKTGQTAYIYESHNDYDKDLLKIRLAENLKDYSFIRRRISTHFLREQLGMTYSVAEFDSIVSHSNFGKNYTINRVELGNLPVYVRLDLKK